MSAKKYAGDYRLENVPGRKGRLRTVPVYRGERYRFSAPPERVRKAKQRLLICMVFASVGLFVPMLSTAEMLRLWYVLLPLVLCLLPAAGLWKCCYTLHIVKETFIRSQKDLIQDHITAWSVCLISLAGASLVGQIAAYISGRGAGEWSSTVSTLVIIASAAFIFRTKKDFCMETIPAE